MRSVAFPAISCGIYGYPLDKAARIAVEETSAALTEAKEIERVIFACFNTEALRVYQELLRT